MDVFGSKLLRGGCKYVGKLALGCNCPSVDVVLAEDDGRKNVVSWRLICVGGLLDGGAVVVLCLGRGGGGRLMSDSGGDDEGRYVGFSFVDDVMFACEVAGRAAIRWGGEVEPLNMKELLREGKVLLLLLKGESAGEVEGVDSSSSLSVEEVMVEIDMPLERGEAMDSTLASTSAIAAGDIIC
jgi:hypothetical protein